jgi:hypothetical protein
VVEEEFRKWLVGITQLTGEQKVELQRRMALLGMSETPKAQKGGREEIDDWLIRGILEEMKSRGRLTSAAFRSADRAKGYKAWTDNRASLYEDIEKRLPDLTRSERDVFCWMCCVSIINALEKRDLPVNVNTILTHMPKLFEYLNESLPEYMRTGMLRHVLTIKGRRGKN